MSEQRRPEYWRQEASDDRAFFRRQLIRYGIVFLILLGFFSIILWFVTTGIRYSATRVERTTSPSYVVSGVVRDADTGAPIPWAHIADSLSGHPPHFETTADRSGQFQLATLPEPHSIAAAALGYRPAAAVIGSRWFFWAPKGEERIELRLKPDPER